MLISVIIPTYKPQSYLWECLDSIAAQSFPSEDFEVLIVLNGCDFPYKSLIQDYINRHRNIQISLIHTLQGGVSHARNVAMDVAKGEYITFIDDDDKVSSTYLEELFQKASPDKISLCYPLAFYDGDNNCFPYSITQEYKKMADKEFYRLFEVRRYFNGPVYKLIHRDIIGKRRFDVSFKNGEDSLFMFLISDRISIMTFTSKDAIYYRRYRQNSATTKKRYLGEKFNNTLNLSVEYSKIYFRNPLQYNFWFYLTRMLAAIKNIFD